MKVLGQVNGQQVKILTVPTWPQLFTVDVKQQQHNNNNIYFCVVSFHKFGISKGWGRGGKPRHGLKFRSAVHDEFLYSRHIKHNWWAHTDTAI